MTGVKSILKHDTHTLSRSLSLSLSFLRVATLLKHLDRANSIGFWYLFPDTQRAGAISARNQI